MYAEIAVAGVVGVFLCYIEPEAHENVDEWLWVVVGDVPPAYLVTDDAPTSTGALEAYIVEMQTWVAAVNAGKSVDDLIPVSVPPTKEHAAMLQTRLAFLRSRILPEYADQ